MATFLIKGTYTADGLNGLQKDKASGREKAFAAACEARGGQIVALYYALGQDDVLAFADLPGHVQAASLAASIGATGMFSSVQTVALLTVSEMDQALGDNTAYRPPGG
jgi:uncharacterized protein with GYD domain